MGNLSNFELLNLSISLFSLFLSAMLFFVHIKNRKTLFNSYVISRSQLRSSNIDLKFVSSEQIGDDFFIKLVLFNPGAIAAIIQSLTIYRKRESRFVIGRFFGLMNWEEISQARWWPTNDSLCKKEKAMADEYKNLYVENHRDIIVRISGHIDRNRYKFKIESNHGGYEHETRVDSTISHFPYAFNQWYSEK